MAEDSKLVQLRLTNEQIECMKAYFLHYDWEFNPVYVDMQCEESTCTPETEVETRNSDPLISPDANARVCVNIVCAHLVFWTKVTDSHGGHQTVSSLGELITQNGRSCTKSFGQCFVIEESSMIRRI